ncbi:MAG: UDP-N-acetylglucosamine 1-carboxyvinyltransferase [Candidatus Delongbacteria bacterium]|nr:UDP-N-acetylglucosamine 1-carboxyvinyltransferase [Candidatus Delongbacteria bacterium]MBN2834634.1 UDP-N-acetylglucosamine 1-carboxyvinyltransferase [Candidatus Delongbacteria bacterium]
MDYFRIIGGKPVSGEIIVSGNKNEALPAIAASLLTNEQIVLKNFPKIADTEIMLRICEKIGVEVKRSDDKIILKAKRVLSSELPDDLSSLVRSSLLFVPGLIHRTGKAVLPKTGGDKIGKRRIDTHINGLLNCGVKLKYDENVVLEGGGLNPSYILLDEASVMATENIVMLAVLIAGETTIYNAACEPHVQGLCNLLNSMGANISGIGTNRLTIVGVDHLLGAEHTIGFDHIEAGSFIGLAAATNGNLRIKNAYNKHMDVILPGFEKIGVKVLIDGDDLVVNSCDKSIRKDFDGSIPTISDQPWPCFPADLMSIMIVCSIFSSGTIVVHEKLFEARLFFTDSLIRMGATIILCDPHRVVVNGPCTLKGITMSSPDIRAGMALLIAAFAAEGESVINNIGQIDRGYFDIENRLKKIGLDIDRCRS